MTYILEEDHEWLETEDLHLQGREFQEGLIALEIAVHLARHGRVVVELATTEFLVVVALLYIVNLLALVLHRRKLLQVLLVVSVQHVVVPLDVTLKSKCHVNENARLKRSYLLPVDAWDLVRGAVSLRPTLVSGYPAGTWRKLGIPGSQTPPQSVASPLHGGPTPPASTPECGS